MSETTKEAFLATLEIFEELGDELYAEELAALAAITDEYEFEDGAVIAYQRDVADRLIVVRSGRLFARSVDEQGIVRESRSFLPGDYFEDRWLFTPGTYPFTAVGAGEGRILIVEEGKFLSFLDKYPYILEDLKLSEEAQEGASKGRISRTERRVRTLNLLADEIVEYDERRSVWVLIFRLALPVLGILVLLAAILWQLQAGRTLVVAILAAPTLVLTGYALLRALDWTNDFFIITNKHLIHREFELRRLSARVNKTPIDQVQSVEVEKPNLVATLLNMGTARVTTAAQTGAILFDYIDNPDLVQNIISRLREQVLAMDAGRAQATMRASLEDHFQATPAYKRMEEPAAEEEEEEEVAAPISRLGALLTRVRRAISSRVEEGAVITYRKHAFTLLVRTWWLILAGLVFFAGLVLVENLQLAIVFLALWLIDLGWFIWRFEDWRNDTFQVTDRYVIDIDRRPFGFGESRKQAELGNVQNVNAVRPSALATIFNYGNVIIETAGATADITFERVVNPNQIQSDIFKRREGFKQRQRVREGEQRRKEYAVLLDVYQQAREQERIPRRTPPGEE